MSDSACSLNEGEFSTATPETWLVQEYCSLGTLQVRLHASACLVNMNNQQFVPVLQPGDLAGATASLPALHSIDHLQPALHWRLHAPSMEKLKALKGQAFNTCVSPVCYSSDSGK